MWATPPPPPSLSPFSAFFERLLRTPGKYHRHNAWINGVWVETVDASENAVDEKSEIKKKKCDSLRAERDSFSRLTMIPEDSDELDEGEKEKEKEKEKEVDEDGDEEMISLD